MAIQFMIGSPYGAVYVNTAGTLQYMGPTIYIETVATTTNKSVTANVSAAVSMTKTVSKTVAASVSAAVSMTRSIAVTITAGVSTLVSIVTSFINGAVAEYIIRARRRGRR